MVSATARCGGVIVKPRRCTLCLWAAGEFQVLVNREFCVHLPIHFGYRLVERKVLLGFQTLDIRSDSAGIQRRECSSRTWNGHE